MQGRHPTSSRPMIESIWRHSWSTSNGGSRWIGYWKNSRRKTANCYECSFSRSAIRARYASALKSGRITCVCYCIVPNCGFDRCIPNVQPTSRAVTRPSAETNARRASFRYHVISFLLATARVPGPFNRVQGWLGRCSGRVMRFSILPQALQKLHELLTAIRFQAETSSLIELGPDNSMVRCPNRHARRHIHVCNSAAVR
jgi:hypothetical protein